MTVSILQEAGVFTALAIGLLGSVHCIGMCGGIMGALTVGVSRAPGSAGRGRAVGYALAYNLGRITSYGVAGAIAGFVGTQFFGLVSSDRAHWIALIAAGGFMVALGLYLTGWTRVLAPVERAGGLLWRRIEPFARRLLPVRSAGHAVGLGLLWGWLPCGLVYSALVLALASGDPVLGALFMVAFGIGTLPMVLTLGATARWLAGLARNHWVRQAAGGVIIVLGVLTVAAPHWLPIHTPASQAFCATP
jgi:sulfite exporter TauE/SafE